MAMMAHTDKGKERTLKEWDYVLGQAGFSRYNVKHSRAVHSIKGSVPTKMEANNAGRWISFVRDEWGRLVVVAMMSNGVRIQLDLGFLAATREGKIADKRLRSDQNRGG
ncbi:hypothetical protein Patl1_35854 [Pistacia atlantica]|nr:hypothetical protein Patl1_35854 [Pistacia atlantica]